MWNGVDDMQHTKHDLTWIVEGIKANSLIWVTDGLHGRKKATDLSGAGWMIFCKRTGLKLTGNFWECSVSASSYRVEMLGLGAQHLLVRALAEFI
jgi:hypothetical protein